MSASGTATGTLALTRYRVTFEALEPLALPEYLGSTLRGAFGHAFRKLCCPSPRAGQCPIPEHCPYHLVFEAAPPPDSEALRTHDEIPRPFVIVPPPAAAIEYRRGDHLVFDLTLIGRAREFLPHFVVTLREVDRLGRGRRAVRLARIDAVNPLGTASETAYVAEEALVKPFDWSITVDECSAAPGSRAALRVVFLTQTRLKHSNGFVRRPEFHVLFRRLLGRLSSLARFRCGAPLGVEFRDLIEQARAVRLVQDATRWTTWARYSSRQDRRMEWAGLVGSATYEGDLAPFRSYLVFGQWTHVGKGATFGLGGYRIEEVG